MPNISMSPDLISALPAVGKGVAAIGAAIPFTGIVKRMLGPAADELAEMWRDQVRLYRYEKQLKCVQKAEKMAEAAGFSPHAVPPKILFPLLEGVSLEENEDLHTMWSALLANASSPDRSDDVRPGYINLLRQMSPDEAAVLNWIFDDGMNRIKKDPKDIPDYHFNQLKEVYCRLCKDTDVTSVIECLSSLEAAYLITKPGVMVNEREFAYGITYRGSRFVLACRPPAPRQE
jgi:hypothetical protein